MKIILYLNFLFWGGGFLYAFSLFFINNGLGNFFEFVKPKYVNASQIVDSVKNEKTIECMYIVNEKEFHHKQTIVSNAVSECDFFVENISYNKVFPCICQIGNNQINLRIANTGMIISGFFFLIIFIIYTFTDHQKWVRVYTKGEYKSSRE